MSPQIFLIRNTVVSDLIALENTRICIVPLWDITQSICTGEFSGFSNYSKACGHRMRLINGLQFFSG